MCHSMVVQIGAGRKSFPTNLVKRSKKYFLVRNKPKKKCAMCTQCCEHNLVLDTDEVSRQNVYDDEYLNCCWYWNLYHKPSTRAVFHLLMETTREFPSLLTQSLEINKKREKSLRNKIEITLSSRRFRSKSSVVRGYSLLSPFLTVVVF